MEKVSFSAPTEKVLFNFYPLVDFYSDEFETQYISGMRYSVREGNVRLYKAVTQWKKEGKVKT